MSRRAQIWHSSVGRSVQSVDTPAALLDLDKFDENNRVMQRLVVTEHKRTWRAHAKAHKSSALGRMQVEAGAVGVLVQKLGEAEAMAEGGVRDVYISNEVVDEAKLERLAALADRCTLSVAVDSLLGLARLVAALRKKKPQSKVRVLVDVDVGHGRCGATLEEAVKLAQAVVADGSDVLTFGGIHCYHGSIQHVRSLKERREAAHSVSAQATVARDRVVAAVGRCDTVTGGGTGTLEFDLEQGVFSELQPGSYAFGDVDYGTNEWNGPMRWRQSLFILGQVMSRGAQRAVLDAGNKCHSLDAGVEPRIHGHEWRWNNGGDEHAILTGHELPQLGEKVMLVPGHIDPTFAMWDHVVGFRNGIVTEIIAVDARGRSD
jgi:D-serine deaminase-like pyridoxal phosphate-dependent protein